MLTCTFEDNQVAHLRHVTVDALIMRDDRLLLVKRSPDYFIEPGKYALPGGYLERDESCDDAVKREVLEETGYRSGEVVLFRIIHRPRLQGDDRQNVTFFYCVTVTDKVGTPDFEIAGLDWFPLDRLPANIAFDHGESIELYRQHLQRPFALPIINDTFIISHTPGV